MSPLLEVADASVRFGLVEAVAGVSLVMESGTAVGLVGPNGAGKTTLLDALSGLVSLDGGTVTLEGRDVTSLPPHRRARLGMARTFQGLELFDELTVEENLQVAAEARRRRSPVPAAALSPVAAVTGDLPAVLAHGRRKAVALSRALAGDPRLLLLDEPAAGLDGPARQELVATLRALVDRGVGLLVADHDVELVLGLCNHVHVLDFGRVIASGPPAAVRVDPAVSAAYLGSAAGPGPARLSPPSPLSPPGNAVTSGAAVPTRTCLLQTRGLVAGYGGSPALHGVDLEVGEGEVVALLGANGAGKTTTLRTLSGVLPITSGRVTVLGQVVAGRAGRAHRLARRGLASVPQDRAVLPSLTVAENLHLAGHARWGRGVRATPAGRGVRATPAGTIETAVEHFPPLAALLERRAGLLSGGEQHLLALARALVARPRLLLVDELSLGLAPRTARQALDTLRTLADGEGMGVLLVEQHPRLALDVADRAVVLTRGRVVFDGPAPDLAACPDILEGAYLGDV